MYAVNSLGQLYRQTFTTYKPGQAPLQPVPTPVTTTTQIPTYGSTTLPGGGAPAPSVDVQQPAVRILVAPSLPVPVVPAYLQPTPPRALPPSVPSPQMMYVPVESGSPGGYSSSSTETSSTAAPAEKKSIWPWMLAIAAAIVGNK